MKYAHLTLLLHIFAVSAMYVAPSTATVGRPAPIAQLKGPVTMTLIPTIAHRDFTFVGPALVTVSNTDGPIFAAQIEPTTLGTSFYVEDAFEAAPGSTVLISILTEQVDPDTGWLVTYYGEGLAVVEVTSRQFVVARFNLEPVIR